MRSRGWPRVPLVWRIGRNRGSDRGALDDARPRPRRVNWPLARFSTTTYYRHAHCGLGPSVDASTPTTACAMPGRLQPRRSTKAGICAVAQPSDKSSPQCYPRPFSHCRLAACQFPTKGSQRRMLNLFLRFDIRRGDGPRDVRSCISTSLARPAHVIKQCRDGHWHWPQDEGTKCSRASLNISGAWRGGQSSHFFFWNSWYAVCAAISPAISAASLLRFSYGPCTHQGTGFEHGHNRYEGGGFREC